MNAHFEAGHDTTSVPLESIEFELALYAQNFLEHGFEAALRAALAKTDGVFLFLMPVPDIPDCQRMAAVRVGVGTESQTLLVLLQADGGTFRIENAANAALAPYADLARSYGGILDSLAI